MQTAGTRRLVAEALREPIRTRRLILRPPVASDLAAICRLINDPVIAENTSLIRYPYPVISGRRWIASAQKAAGPFFHMPHLMTLRSNPRLFTGVVGIDGDEAGVLTIGYWVAVRYRRRGFASEAARALIDAAFSLSGATAIGASARISNAASQRVLEAIGMRRVGRGRIRSAQLGCYVPTFVYRLDRASWEHAQAASSR